MKKVLGFWDLILFNFCAIFGLEAIAASAAIGFSAIFWWIIGAIFFFFPFGLIVAELGATYPQQGGLYIWIKNSLGKKWAARATWYYWISLPIWTPAIYIAIVDIISHAFSLNISLLTLIIVGIVLIWLTVLINLCSMKIAKWIPNIGSFTKLIVLVGLISAAIIFAVKNGFSNEIIFTSIAPTLGAAIVFIPIIIYNLTGLELVSSAAGEMKNPKKDIPKTIIISAITIAALYLISTIAIWAVIPHNEINISTGVIEVFTLTSEDYGAGIIGIIAAILIAITLFSGPIAWTLGENRVVAQASKEKTLPRILGKLSKKEGVPEGAAILSGIISTLVLITYGFVAGDASTLFWHILSFSIIINLFTYLLIIPSFIILRGKKIKRPYSVPGPNWFAKLLAVIVGIVLIATIILLIMQPGTGFMEASFPIIIGILATIIIGEFLINYAIKHQ